jgi:gluconate 2-dehydrogenase alpha chain
VLAQAGLRVVALEAGPRLDASMMTLDEVRNDVREWLSQPKAAHERPTLRAHVGEDAVPTPWATAMVNGVGGTTVHYAAVSPRLTPWNFRTRTLVEERYGRGAIPEGSTLVDWPLDYDELEPYYALVEREIGICGDAARNPFEGRRSGPYPMPPLRRSGWNDLMAAAAGRAGWHPYAAPATVNSEPYNGFPACTYCGFCTYNGCYRNAKGSTNLNVIPAAEATGNLEVVTDARVLSIDVGRDGRASSVTYVRDGCAQTQPAKVVLVGTFTYENTRLLLLSRSAAFPNGICNNAGQVGQHFMAHPLPQASGHFPGVKLNLFRGLWPQATCIDDFDGDNFDHRGLGFVGGGMLQTSQELKPIAASQWIPPWLPRWGSAWKRWISANAQSVGSVHAQLEGLSYEGNFLDLDPVVRDRDGVPVVRITYSLRESERRGYEFLRARLEEWLLEAGAAETWSTVVGMSAGSLTDSMSSAREHAITIEGRHAYGGTRMGDDPETSVVDRFCFAHEVPNLGLMGASVFPTTGGHNPTLTVQALAWRTAEHLVRNYGEIAGE